MVYEETEVVAEVEAVAPIPDVLNHEPLVPQEAVLPPLENLALDPRPPVQVEPPLEQPLPPDQLYYQQPPRPITEMLGSGSFYFLQDSELDTPDTQQIPSQTFTNQSFVSGPPPPIPMPPHFQTFPPGNAGPVGNNGIEAHPPEQVDDAHKQRGRPRAMIQQQPQQMYPNNNGYNRPRQNRSGGRPNNRQHQ